MLTRTNIHSKRGFTLIELLITITVIAVLAGIVTVTATTLQKSTRDSARDSQAKLVSSALEKYYRTNGEYPSVALMTSSNVDSLKKKINVPDPTVFKLPNSSSQNSITVDNASPTRLVYAANVDSTDSAVISQCQTDPDGYCDGYTLQYIEEGTNTPVTIQSLNATFEAVKDGDVCNEGDTKNGTTCTHSYPAQRHDGTYSCPSGGNLSGTTCTSTYGAYYASGGGYYYCPSGGTLSGSSCNSSYAATASSSERCPAGTGYVPGANYPVCASSYPPSQSSGYYSCPSGGSLSGSTCTVDNSYSAKETKHVKERWEECTPKNPKKGQKVVCVIHPKEVWYTYSCPSGGSLSGATCVKTSTYSATYNPATTYCPGNAYYALGSCWGGYVDPVLVTTYSCPSGGSLSGSTCYTSYGATYASYSGYYYCSGSDSLSGTACTNSYAATRGADYYTCPNGGVATGSTCSYTYELQG